jgi:hypothetical protein
MAGSRKLPDIETVPVIEKKHPAKIMSPGPEKK